MTSASVRARPGGFSTSSGAIPIRERVRRSWDYRRILVLLVRRDLKVRYAGSWLGYLWTMLDPLLMSLIFWLVFTQIFDRRIGFAPYILFLVLGQFVWSWFAGGVTQATRALRSEAQMVRSSSVPRELWVVRVALSKGVEFLYSLPVIVVFALGYRKAPTWGLLLLPVAMVLCFVTVLGFGLILAPLSVLVRDIDRVVPILVRFLFYCSPVLYSVQDVPPHLRALAYYNPLSGFIVLTRASFYPQEVVWHSVAFSAVFSAVLFAVGAWVFARLERQVLKEI